MNFGTARSMRVQGAEVSSEGVASGTVMCPRREGQFREGARPFSASGRCSDFLLGTAMGPPVRQVCCLFRMLLIRWNTYHDPDEDQNLTTTITISVNRYLRLIPHL